MKNKFENLLDKEGKKVFNYLRKILRNNEDAEDILQETFISLYKRIDFIKEEAIETYLYRTAYHKALNLIRKRKTYSKFNINISSMENIEQVEKKEEADNSDINNALAELSVEYATLIELKYYQNKSYKEIAEILDLTVSAVDSRLVRAKKKLKKIIIKRSKKKLLVSKKAGRK